MSLFRPCGLPLYKMFSSLTLSRSISCLSLKHNPPLIDLAKFAFPFLFHVEALSITHTVISFSDISFLLLFSHYVLLLVVSNVAPGGIKNIVLSDLLMHAQEKNELV